MKIFTLTQPLASLMAIGAKRNDTRGFRTPYRGEIAIHAAGSLRGLPEIMKMRGMVPTNNQQDFVRLCLSEPFNSVLTAHMRSLETQTLNSYLDQIPMGGIVCVVDLAQCLSTNGGFMQMSTLDFEMKDGKVIKDESFRVDYRKPPADSAEFAFGNYGPDRWMWFTENLRKLRQPVPCKGYQGLRDLPADTEALVRAQL